MSDNIRYVLDYVLETRVCECYELRRVCVWCKATTAKEELDKLEIDIKEYENEQ